MFAALALLILAIAFGLTVLATPVVRTLALRYGWVDAPDGQRKLHDRTVASIGGLAIATGLACALLVIGVADHFLFQSLALPPPVFFLGAVAMLVTGMVDDTRGLGFKSKFLVQILVAYILLMAGFRLDLSSVPLIGGDGYTEALLSIPLTLIWIVGVINAVNLIDGLDGLAAGVAFIAFGTLAIIFGLSGQFGLMLVALAIAGSLAGFLFFNFNPASIFMGDSGSLMLGYLLAVMSLQGWGHLEPGMAWLVPVVVLGLPLLDTGLSIVRRMAAGRAIFAPDRDHIHHRLVQRLPYRQAVGVMYIAALGFGMAAISMSLLPPVHASSVLVMVGLLSIAGVRQLGYHEVPVNDQASPAQLSSDYGSAGGDGVAHASPDAVEARPARRDSEPAVASKGIGRRFSVPTKGAWE